jgi:DNA mismatch repair protein MutS2
MEAIMNKRACRVLEFTKIKEQLEKMASSSMGKKIVKDLLPSSNYDEVSQWMNETSEITSMLVRGGSFPMGPIAELGIYLKRAAMGAFLYPGELIEVSDTLRTARRIKQHIKKANTSDVKYPIFKDFEDQISSFKNIEDLINISIISEHEVSDHASSELMRIRKDIDKKHQAIRSKLNSIITSDQMQKYLQDNLITIREDRFVVPVRSEHKSHLKGIVHDRSSSGNTLYIEPMAVVELNNDLKELKLQEKAEIERILSAITEEIYLVEEALVLNEKLLGHIDFCHAKGRLSLALNGMPPVLLKEKRLKLRNARHPFIDPKDVVPSNLWLGGEFSTLLITGPNTGGKTVTLKTLGLLVLMTQSGLHIPVDYGTEMCIFDEVYADIGDEQSIEQSLSTFSSHMTNIVNILNHVSENDLVLFDELGAGTDPTEGAALAMAILSKLYERKIRTLATTHYSELKHFAFTSPGVENACVEFDVETLSPTYKLLIGVPGKSNAFEISRKLGLKDDVILSAKALVDENSVAFEDILTSIESKRKDSESALDDAIKLRMEAEKLKKHWHEKDQTLAEKQNKAIEKAKLKANQILKQAKEDADTIIKELRQIKTVHDKEENKRIEAMRKTLKDGIEDTYLGGDFKQDLSGEIPKKLKIGQPVYVTSLDQKGEVAVLPNAKGEVVVRIGIMKMTVALNQLRRCSPNADTKKKTSSSAFVPSSDHLSMSTDVRGMNFEDASYHIEKYLDDVVLSNLETVTIIHGKGTGVLREKLREYFKRHPYVSNFREGASGEGGSGVTVVTIKH